MVVAIVKLLGSTTDRSVLEQALELNFQDFEDAVQYASGMAYGVEVIVTRDASGFVDAEIPVMLPGELNRTLDRKRVEGIYYCCEILITRINARCSNLGALI